LKNKYTNVQYKTPENSLSKPIPKVLANEKCNVIIIL